MFSKYQITGIALSPVNSVGTQNVEDQVAIVINHTQLCFYEILSGKQIYRNVMDEKEDILELHWSKTKDMLFVSFSHHYLKYLSRASMQQQYNSEFAVWDGVYDTSCLAYHPRMADKLAFGVFNYTRVFVIDIESKTSQKYEYTSDDYEVHTTAVAFDPNHDTQIYIGCSDNCLYLCNFKDDFLILKWNCFDNAPYEIVPNPIKIGYFTVNVKQKQELYELQSASNKVQNVVRIPSHYVSNHMNLQLDSRDPKNWTGDMLISSKNGSVMVYNIMNHCIKWISDPSHQDTIFDTKVVENYLCSCSFLGEVKVFNVYTNKEYVMYKTQDMINSKNADSVYHISISPKINGCFYLCGVTYLGYLYIWSLDDISNTKPKLKYSFSERKRALICSWNQLDWTKIALGSETMKSALVLNIEMLMSNNKFKGFNVTSTAMTEHDGRSVYGVYFGTLPENKNHLLTCASDGRIRIFTPPYNKPISEIQAHSNRAFNAKFSLYYYNLIVSVSDDKTVSVSDFKSGTREIMVGHTNKIRGLEFVYGLKNMVITGDWNGMIIMWNYISKQAVYKYNCHSNDVYGIASCSEYPMCVWTSSRDSTIRTHQLNKLVVAFNIAKVLECKYKLSLHDYGEVVYSGTNLLDLLDLYVCNPYYKSISSNINVIKQKKANTMVNVPHFTCNNNIQKLLLEERYRREVDKMINPNRVMNLKLIADEFLTIGCVERFCDINFEVKNYEKALIFAPAVGLDYWKHLMREYILVLKEKQLDEQYEYSTIIGEFEETLKRNSDYKNTNLNIINSVTQGYFPNMEVKVEKGIKNKEYRFFYNRIIKDSVRKEMVGYNPYMALGYYLSYENIESALAMCHNLNDFMLGMLISELFGRNADFLEFFDLLVDDCYSSLDLKFIRGLKNKIEDVKELRVIYAKLLIQLGENEVCLEFDGCKYAAELKFAFSSNSSNTDCLKSIVNLLEADVVNYSFDYNSYKPIIQCFLLRYNKNYSVNKNFINSDSLITEMVLYSIYFGVVRLSELRQYELIYNLGFKFILLYQSIAQKASKTLASVAVSVAVKLVYASYYHYDSGLDNLEKAMRTFCNFDGRTVDHISNLLDKLHTSRKMGNPLYQQNEINMVKHEYGFQMAGENLPSNEGNAKQKKVFKNQINMFKILG